MNRDLSARVRSRRRVRRGVLGGLGALVVVAVLGQPGSAAAPQEIPGDPQSARVATLAAEALDALAPGGRGDEAGAFDAALMDTAAATAVEIGVDPREMQSAWGRVGRQHQVAVLTALVELGVEYRSMASEPGVGFDCSGLTSYAWASAGVELPRSSGDQIAVAATRDETTAQAGDLVQYPGHVMMYLGVGDAIVHSANEQSDVELAVIPGGQVDGVRFGDPDGGD